VLSPPTLRGFVRAGPLPGEVLEGRACAKPRPLLSVCEGPQPAQATIPITALKRVCPPPRADTRLSHPLSPLFFERRLDVDGVDCATVDILRISGSVRSSATGVMIASLLLIACTEPPRTNTRPPPQPRADARTSDVGTTPEDSGQTEDAGFAVDAGDPNDSGESPVDASPADTGPAPTDTGPADTGLADTGRPDMGAGPGQPFVLSSTAYMNGGMIPRRHSCRGIDVQPELSWSNAPAGTMSFAIVLIDDSIDFTHWVAYNIPASTSQLPESASDNRALPNGTQEADAYCRQFCGPCPGTTHTYTFKIFALDVATINFPFRGGFGDTQLMSAFGANTLGTATLTATFTP
jgi:Raf kinase inhibitor-like YbhB/YbcL family protein